MKLSALKDKLALKPDQSIQFYEDIVETIRDPLLVLDSDLRVLYANQRFYDAFKVTVQETIANLIYDLGNRQWNIPKLRKLLEEVLPKKKRFNDYQIEHVFPSIGRRIMLLNARRITNLPGEQQLILLAIEDVTEHMRIEYALKTYEERFHAAFDTAKDGLLLIDKTSGKILNSNKSAQDLLGYSINEMHELNLWEIGFVQDDRQFQIIANQLEKMGSCNYRDVTVKNREGRMTAADIFLTDRTELIQCNIRDITERKEMQQSLQIMSDTQGQLLQMEHIKEVQQLVGKKIQELSADGYVLVSELDERTQAIKLAGWFGFGPIYDKLVKLFKIDPAKNVYPLKDMTAEELRLFRSGKLERFPGGLYALMTRKIPKNVCLAMEKQLKLKELYTQGFVHAGKHLGGIIILARSDITPHKAMIEIIIQQASIAINRINAREALEESEERFRSLYENATIGMYRTTPGGKILMANPALVKMLAYPTFAELAKRDLNRKGFEPPYPRQEFMREIEKEGETHGYESAWNKKDGSSIFVRESTRVVRDGSGKALYYEGTVEDISKRRRAEQEVRESEERYRSLFEDSPVSLWEEDFSAVKQRLDALKGKGVSDLRAYLESHPQEVADCAALVRVLDVNKATLTLLKAKKKDDLIKKSLAAIISPQFHQEFREELIHIANGLSRFTWEGVNQTLTGEPVDVSVTWCAAPGHENDLSKVLVSIVDITQSKKMEQLLKNSEQRFRDIAENSLEWIWEVDAEGKYIFASKMVEKILGYTAEEVLQKHFYDLFHPEDREAAKAAALAAFAARQSFREFTNRNVHKNGQIVWLSTSALPMLDGRGNLLGYRGADTDITDRKRTEKALHESEERYQLANRATYNVIWDWDLQTNAHWWNDNFQTIFGYRVEEIEPGVQSWTNRIHPEDRERVDKGIYEAIDSGEPSWTDEYRFRCQDGTYAVVEDRGTISRDASGKALRMIGAMQDITQRKQAEIEMRRLINDLRNLSEVEKKNRLLAEALAKNVISLRSTLRTDEILDSIIENASEVIPSDAFNIMLIEGDAARVVRSRGYQERGLGDWIRQKQFNLNELKIEQEVIRSKKFKITPSTGKSKEWVTYPETAWIKSHIISPILEDEKVIGFVNADSATPEFFTQEHAQNLTVFTDQISTALKNARLFEDTQRRMNRMQAMTQIDQAINSSLDLEISLEVVLIQAREQLQADAADILLLDDVTHSLVYSRAKGFRTGEIRKANIKLGSGLPGKAVLERTTVAIPDLNSAPESYFKNLLVEREGFVSYYCASLITKGQLKGVMEIYFRHAFQADREWLEFLEILAQQTAIAINNAEMLQTLQSSNVELLNAYEATLRGWVDALDMRDHETEGHTQRVTEVSLKLAKSMGVKGIDLVNFERGALLHDIGKVAIPDAILKKPGPLTEEEWVIMRRHPLEAHTLLSKSNYLLPALDIPYSHHEKWDGSGYPLGLKGGAIPLAARIFAIVDVWDALTSDRPYRKAWTEKKALEYIQEQKGQHFDPQVVSAFLAFLQKDQK